MQLLFRKTKIFIIVFLVFLATYQTFNLWFEDFSNHRFFYTLKNIEYKEINQRVENNLKSIIINLGNNKFIQDFNTSNNSIYKNTFDNTISYVIKKGKFTEQPLDINSALDNKGIIYNYPYEIMGEDIKVLFNVNNKNIYKIPKFNLIAILPNFKSLDKISVIFFDTKSLKQYEFHANKSKSYNISEIINTFYVNSNENYYLSSVKSGFNLFENNQFILTWEGNSFDYNKLTIENPVNKNNQTSLKLLETYVNHFFQNPAVKWSYVNQDTVTYSDESTVVKYSNGILEYSDYKITNNTNNKTLFELYNIATNFINNDIKIKNDYFLKNYELNENQVTFYFDYKINNLPINVCNINNEKSDMNSMLEVTVSQNKVTKYRKFVYNFYKSEKSTLEKDFLTAIDNIIYKYYTEGTSYKIKNIELAYNFNPQDIEKDLSIGWFININDKLYFES